jgi:imidazoleglycerol-phosphate dehydratase/histidinol-phosphatase
VKRVVFVDRDGTIIKEPPDEQIDSLEKLEFVPGVITGMKSLVDSGYTLVMVTNQDGLGTKRYPRKKFVTVQTKVLGLLEGEGIEFERVCICPHRAEENCNCRKPKTGLVRSYLRSNTIDRDRSFVLGDRESDVEFAENLGVRSVRVTSEGSSNATYFTPDVVDACKFILRSVRYASVKRSTRETKISATVSIDGGGVYAGTTSIGFFDHMLDQLAKHSLMDLTLNVVGDLHIDEHHTVEDVGIVLGEAIRKALGDKRGIERFSAPLDESLASVVLDLSGRSYLRFKCSFRRERVGELPTELVEDFFRAFAQGLKATLHITCEGRNDHHKIESIFKAVGRALKSAAAINGRNAEAIPSTKGTL